MHGQICERGGKQETSGLNGTGCTGEQEEEGGAVTLGSIPGRGVVSARVHSSCLQHEVTGVRHKTG